MARLEQQYQMFVTTHRQLERDAAGGRRRYWTGVMTLVHKELLPNLESVPLDCCGLTGEQQRACAGRVVVVTVVSCGQRQEVPNEAGQGVHSRMHYFVNVYQHTAAKHPQQRQLLEGLSALFRFLSQRATAILVLGDFNAAWGGQLEGYETDFRRTDDLFTRWVSAEDLQLQSRSYEH
eukprot:1867723-Rhodomonas_salina.2